MTNGNDKQRYTVVVSNKWITSDCSDIDDFIAAYIAMADQMHHWKELGIELDDHSNIQDDKAEFYTYDEEVAEQEGFELDESDDDQWFIDDLVKDH